MKRYSTNLFTNPNGARVAQAFHGGMPITRELDDPDRARAAARRAYDDHNGHATLEEWDGDSGEPARILAEK